MAQAFLNGTAYDRELSCYALLIERTVTEVSEEFIPEGVTRIGTGAFAYWAALEKVTLPEGVIKVGSQAFRGCAKLTELNLPQSLEELDREALMDCAKLKRLVLPPKVKYIPITFASACFDLTEVICEGNIEYIWGYAFQYCNNCKKYDFTNCTGIPVLNQITSFINIPADSKIFVPAALYSRWVEATNWSAFADHIVPVLDDGYYPEEVSEGLYYSRVDGNGEVSDGYYVAGRGSFEGEELVIPEKYDGLTVKGIHRDALRDDDKTTLIYLPPSITYIDNGNFCSCANLKRIYLHGVTDVYSLAFMGLIALEYVEFGSDISSIGDDAFAGCNGAVYNFSNCTAVPTLDMYGEPPLEFGTDPLICVPEALLEEWRTATNWSYFADYIVAAG